jgi:hypothetical protein
MQHKAAKKPRQKKGGMVGKLINKAKLKTIYRQ